MTVSTCGHSLTLAIVIVACLASARTNAQEILLHKKDATVWGMHQTIHGSVRGFKPRDVTIFQDTTYQTVTVDADSSFTFTIDVHQGLNQVWASAQRVVSDTLRLILGYRPAPLVTPVASVSKNKVHLHPRLMENPGRWPLRYTWHADA